MDFVLPEGLKPRIVFEDSSLVAVYKPARMHSAPGLGEGDLCAWVFERYPEARLESGRSKAEGGLLHRLDFETSGLVLFARTEEAFLSLLDQQEKGLFRKEYLALASSSREEFPEGSRPREGFPSGVAQRAWAAARWGQDLGAQAALLRAALAQRPGEPPFVSSHFRPFGPRGSRVACLEKAESRGGALTPVYRSDILEAALLPTSGDAEGGEPSLGLRLGISRGFRHQIRAHLAWIGLPLLGDALYGGGADARLRLHAVRRVFVHPLTHLRCILDLPAIVLN